MSVVRRAPYVLLVFASRIVLAAMAAYPVFAIATRAFGGWPQGDAALFEPGSMMLLELVRLHRVGIDAWLTQGLLATVVAVPVGFVTNALLLAALAAPSDAPAGVAARAVSSMRALGVAWAAFAAVLCAWACVCYALVEAFRGSVEQSSPTRDWIALVVVLAGGAVTIVIGVLHDVTRAMIVLGVKHVPAAFVASWECARERWWPLLAGWWARGAAGVLLVVLELWAMRRVPLLSGSSAWLGALVHGAIMLGLIVLRASWLSMAIEVAKPRASVELAAMRTVGVIKDEAIGTAARTGEPDDPSSGPGA
jgi:hypothetical protein